MKLVINKCYGGFSLSPKAVKRMAELQGRECYFFTSRSSEGEYDLHKHFPISLDEAGANRFFFTAYDVPNPDEVLAPCPAKNKRPATKLGKNALSASDPTTERTQPWFRWLRSLEMMLTGAVPNYVSLKSPTVLNTN